MNLLTDHVRKLYIRYLVAAFGGSLVAAIYGLVDCMMVGQYEGPNGVAALATVTPMWNILYSVGLLFGIGGSVLMSTARGAEDTPQSERSYTAAAIGLTVVTAIIWAVLWLWEDPLLRLFGADDVLLPLAKKYVFWIRFVAPLFPIGQFMACFARNDNAPALATAAVITGGVTNIFGDYLFVFVFDMGISGAGLATALGQVLVVIILSTHYLSKRCGLHFRRPQQIFALLRRIGISGFSVFIVDLAVGILATMFNNQIMFYEGSDALAVYGVIINVSMLMQCCAYGVGQAVQPLLSINYGAGKLERVQKIARLGTATAILIGLIGTGLFMAFPTEVARMFMDPTPEVLAIAPGILRRYFVSFLLLVFNIYSTFYFQAMMCPGISIIVSALRTLLLSGALVYLLPALFGAQMLWWVMPITELVVAVLVVVWMAKERKKGLI